MSTSVHPDQERPAAYRRALGAVKSWTRAFAILLAFTTGASAAPPDLDDEPPSRPPGTTRLRMQSHFEELQIMERLLLRGDLEAVREHATGIVFDRSESEQPMWAAHIARMRQAAVLLSTARTVEEAARAETRLARECATCHQASSAMPTFAVPDAPADDATLAGRMARHQWAADRLWEGLVGLSDQAWRDGLDVLAAAPLPARSLSDDAAEVRLLARYARDLQRAARRATPTHTPAARAAAYANLLVVCVRCHARTGADY